MRGISQQNVWSQISEVQTSVTTLNGRMGEAETKLKDLQAFKAKLEAGQFSSIGLSSGIVGVGHHDPLCQLGGGEGFQYFQKEPVV